MKQVSTGKKVLFITLTLLVVFIILVFGTSLFQIFSNQNLDLSGLPGLVYKNRSSSLSLSFLDSTVIEKEDDVETVYSYSIINKHLYLENGYEDNIERYYFLDLDTIYDIKINDYLYKIEGDNL